MDQNINLETINYESVQNAWKNDYIHETNNRAKKYTPPLWVNFLGDAKIDVG